MKQRTLVIALVVVGAALAVAVGIIIGSRMKDSPKTSASTSDTSTGSTTTPAGSSPTPTRADMGLGHANLACGVFYPLAPKTLDDAVTRHGVSTGQITQDASAAGLSQVDDQGLDSIASYASQAATEDPRWQNLATLITTAQNAAIAEWDQGGKSVGDAASDAYDQYGSQIKGICSAASTELRTVATSLGTTAPAFLKSIGGSDFDITDWGIISGEYSSGQ